ncbi:MAG: phosphate ABC transporter permease subunit PstC [Halococcoides sp.]
MLKPLTSAIIGLIGVLVQAGWILTRPLARIVRSVRTGLGWLVWNQGGRRGRFIWRVLILPAGRTIQSQAHAIGATVGSVLPDPLTAAGKRLLAPLVRPVDRLDSVVRTLFRRYDRRGLGKVTAGGVLAGIALATFVLGSSLVIVPVLASIVVLADTWVTHQREAVLGITFLTTIGAVLVLGLIVTFIAVRSWPAFRRAGLSILLPAPGGSGWPPSADGTVSLAPMLYGTIATTIIATLIAAPAGVAGALFISEIAPDRVRSVVKPGVELMAGIPSITYGFVGFVIVNDFFYSELSTPTIGNYATVGTMIGLMALPTVVSVSEDAIATVPESMKSGSLAIGSTDWQTMKSVTIPAALSGISAAILLGVGRAMGETMAATVMIPHTKGFPDPLYDVFGGVGETLTTVIAFEAGNAQGLHLSALFAAGVVLFGMVMVISVSSQLIEYRMRRILRGES